MTKVKGRWTNWIEAKVRALATPVAPAPIVEKAPPHVRVAERGSRIQDRHASIRRCDDRRGHRSVRAR